jgi:GNAT superfamily N-acetyltransferase
MAEVNNPYNVALQEVVPDDPNELAQQWLTAADQLFVDAIGDYEDGTGILWDDDLHLYVATHDTNLVSAVNLSLPQNGGESYVYGMATAEEWTSRRVGYLLMRHVIDIAADMGCASMRLRPLQRSKPFYTRLRFRQISVGEKDWILPLR